jgi:hypothetical protein
MRPVSMPKRIWASFRAIGGATLLVALSFVSSLRFLDTDVRIRAARGLGTNVVSQGRFALFTTFTLSHFFVYPSSQMGERHAPCTRHADRWQFPRGDQLVSSPRTESA